MFPLLPLDHLRILASMFYTGWSFVLRLLFFTNKRVYISFVVAVVLFTLNSSASFLVSSILFSSCVISSTCLAHYKETLKKKLKIGETIEG